MMHDKLVISHEFSLFTRAWVNFGQSHTKLEWNNPQQIIQFNLTDDNRRVHFSTISLNWLINLICDRLQDLTERREVCSI